MTEDVNPRWPRRSKPWTLAAFCVSVLAAAVLVLWYVRGAAPLQRFYFGQYLKLSTIGDGLIPSTRPGRNDGKFEHTIVEIGGTPADNEAYESTPGKLTKPVIRVNPDHFRMFLHDWIYYHHSIWRWLLFPLVMSGLIAVGLLSGGIYLDRQHNVNARNGRWLRGTRLMSRFMFNLRTWGTGIGIVTTDRRNILERLRAESGYMLRIKRKDEPKHIEIAGDTGAGKSTVIRMLLKQIRERMERAVVYDPGGEYLQEFFNPDIDIVLNVKDERMPFWDLAAECGDEAETFPIATAMFPPSPNKQEWFEEHSRAITAYLMATYKDSKDLAADLAQWMAHPEMIDDRVKGTEHETTLTKNAAPQRAGVLGTMNKFARALRMLPRRVEGRPVFTIKEWTQSGEGCIFITTTAKTEVAVRPLVTMWLDLILQELQGPNKKLGRPKTWVILDEVASLNQLPELASALTRQRKSGNPIILGMQGMAQMEDNYGRTKAEVMTSQPYTLIVMRTKEKRAAEHLEGMIGQAQIERINEHRPAGLFGRLKGRSYTSSRLFEPPVSADEIKGLPDLEGYFVQRGQVVKFHFDTPELVVRAPKLIEREIPPARRPAPPRPQEDEDEEVEDEAFDPRYASSSAQQQAIEAASRVAAQSPVEDFSIFGGQ